MKNIDLSAKLLAYHEQGLSYAEISRLPSISISQGKIMYTVKAAKEFESQARKFLSLKDKYRKGNHV